MVQMDRAVGIDLHQRAGLVEVGGGEADPELDRRQREALLEDAVAGVERGDRLAPRAHSPRCRASSAISSRRDIVLDRHVIGRQVAAGAVEIGLAHVERIEPEMRGDGVDRPLDRHHPLRPAEAAEGGVGDGVGLAAGARRSRPRAGNRRLSAWNIARSLIARRQVGGGAAARGQLECDALDPAVAVEADIVVGGEIVALAGHDHVVVAVGADLGRAAGLGGDQSAGGGISGGLGLLAAEPAAHPADLDGHVGAAAGRAAAAIRCWTSLGCWVELTTWSWPASPGMASAAWPSR